MLGCASPGAAPEFLEEVIASVFHDFDGPIAIGLRSGHVSRQNVTLVFGMSAELNLALHAEPQLRLEWE
jgi:muramoyltetrapeptide carboxypeptidase